MYNNNIIGVITVVWVGNVQLLVYVTRRQRNILLVRDFLLSACCAAHEGVSSMPITIIM